MTLTIELTPEQLATLPGISDISVAYRDGTAKERPTIRAAAQAAEQCKSMRGKKKEYLSVLTLDAANRLIANRVVSVGTLTAALVHPREVFVDAITDKAASIIVVHNHPSGSLEPSRMDNEITKRLKECGELIGIKLLDHVIVTEEGHESIFDEEAAL